MTSDPVDELRVGFGPLVARVARNWRRAVDRELQPFGLTEATWLPLIYVARASTPMRQKELAKALTLDGSSLVRLLDALEASRLIERREETADRRAKVITLTRRGWSLIERVEAASEKVRQRSLAGLTEDELDLASRVLARISGNLAEQLNE
jgi:MarR family transcriptional regulator, transcriptional regulator for hemolysin